MTLKTTLSICPKCGSDLAIVSLTDHNTPSGVQLGSEFVKCRAGCSKAEILGRPRNRPKQMPDKLFLKVLFHAREAGKRISEKDLSREAALYQRLINSRRNGARA